MPLGCTSLVPRIVQDLEEESRVRPGQRFLDLGIGYGFWAAAIRQWVDRGIEPSATYIMGVEGFGKYRSKCWSLYDYVHEMTIERYLTGIGRDDRFDVILILDVIEHFTPDEGSRVMLLAAQKLLPGGRLYVGTPAVWQEQGAANGNDLEVHKSLWTAAALRIHGFKILESGEQPNQYGHRMLLGVYAKT